MGLARRNLGGIRTIALTLDIVQERLLFIEDAAFGVPTLLTLLGGQI